MRAKLLLSCLALAVAGSHGELANAQASVHTAAAEPADTAIPPMPLNQALSLFAERTGLQLVYVSALTEGMNTQGAPADLEPAATLQALLQGTGLDFRFINDKTVTIAKPEALQGSALPAEESVAALQLAQEGDNGSGATETTLGETVESTASSVETSRRSGIEEIIVTAQKREERIQDIPIAISAFSAEDLDVQKLEGGFDLLKAIPNVSFTKTNFTGYNFQIRGIGTQSISATSDPGVAVSFNGTAIIQNRLFEQEYLDIERVEVLRGPQGTLYGRNSTGGVVNVISARPDLYDFSTTLKSEVGNYNTRRGSAVINLPLVEGMLGMRIAGAYTSRDGYDYNTITGNHINGRDLWTARISFGFEPTDWMRGNLVYERFSEDDNRSRTGKQLCHRDDGPEYIDGVQVQDPAGTPQQQLLRSAMFSQGCRAGSLYSDGAFGTPNGLSLNFVLGMLSLRELFNIGQDASGTAQVPIRFQDPYAGLMQSRNLREVASINDPRYQAEADLVTLNLDFELGSSLSLHSQTAYVDDQTYSFQDYNRFNTVPMFIDSSSLDARFQTGTPSPYRGLTPGGIFCDPQLGCSDSVAGFDIARASAEQFSQELRLQSAFEGPLNFSIGANYTRFDVLADYYVMYNLLTAYAMMGPFNYPTGATFDPTICFTSGFAGGGPAVPLDDPLSVCPYIDPNPVERMDGDGHNYFRSKNPYELRSHAVFGELYWQYNEALKFTAGLRYTRDEKRFTPVPSQILLAPSFLAGGYVSRGYPADDDIVQKWGELTGRLGFDWKLDTGFTDETMLYAFYSRGYKGGGANPPSPGFATWDDLVQRGVLTQQEADAFEASAGVSSLLQLTAVEYEQTFEPEFVNAFEVGAKNTLFGGAMMLNATAFYYDYKDYQVSQVRDRTAVNENFDAKVWGLEIEALLSPTPDLQVIANVGYLRTRVDDGEGSIDIMNRAQGNPDYVVAKPWAQLPSNCVVPAAVAAHRLQTAGTTNYFEVCGGYHVLGHSLPLIDPATGQVYDVNDYPELNGGAGLLADLGGNELPNSPRFTANLGAQYGIDFLQNQWRATLRGDFYWQSESYHRIYNYEPYDRLKSWHNVNLGLRFEHPASALMMELYVKNVLNDTPITGAFLNSDDTGLTTNVFTLDPRLIGLNIRKEF